MSDLGPLGPLVRSLKYNVPIQGWMQDFWKGDYKLTKVWEFAFPMLSHLTKISYENENNLVSLRQNYFIFIRH